MSTWEKHKFDFDNLFYIVYKKSHFKYYIFEI